MKRLSRPIVGLLSIGVVTLFALQLGCQSEKVTAKKPKPPEFNNSHFEAPFRLMVESKPLNSAAKQMYPSPAMFDVDNDGQSELVVGDIFGSLNVYENQNDGDGDPVWSSHYALKSADGEAIKVSNW